METRILNKKDMEVFESSLIKLINRKLDICRIYKNIIANNKNNRRQLQYLMHQNNNLWNEIYYFEDIINKNRKL